MKQFLYSLSGLGLVSILVMGASVSSAGGDKQKSPLRGAWSFSQFVPTTTALGPPAIPTASAGTLFMKEDNSFTRHAVLNTPLSSPLGPALELDFNGRCTFREGGVKNGMDCLVNVPAFGLSGVGRFCVVMANSEGCFDEFRCVNTNEPGTVLLVEFKRQSPDACQ